MATKKHGAAFGRNQKPETMLKLAYALHKLRIKHATRQAIHLKDSVAATQFIIVQSEGEHPS